MEQLTTGSRAPCRPTLTASVVTCVVLLFTALWLTAATMLIKSTDASDRAVRRPQGLHRRKGADRSRKAVPAAR